METIQILKVKNNIPTVIKIDGLRYVLDMKGVKHMAKKGSETTERKTKNDKDDKKK